MSDKGQCRHCGKPYTLCGCFIARLAEEANAANVATAAQRTLFAVAAKELRSALDALAAMTASRDRLAAYVRLLDNYLGDIEAYEDDHKAIAEARAAVDAAGDLEEPNAKG